MSLYPITIILKIACYYFAKSSIFAKYIGHRGLSVCLSVCLFVCLSVFKGCTGRTDCPIVLIF